MLGGGVGDSYQPIEKRYQLTRGALQLVHDFGFPVHVLTKSTLVTRDVDILKAINERSRAIVSFSFSSVDERDQRHRRAPRAASGREAGGHPLLQGPGHRLRHVPASGHTPRHRHAPELLEEAVAKASEAGVDFIIFGAMTLKEGRQRDYFEARIGDHYPAACGGVRAHLQGQQVGGTGPGVRRVRWAGPSAPSPGGTGCPCACRRPSTGTSWARTTWWWSSWSTSTTCCG